MSWFQDDAVVLDERPHETVAEGVTLRRRGLLRLSAATVAAGLAAACSSPLRRGTASAAAPTDGALDVTAFLDEMMPRAKRFVASEGKGDGNCQCCSAAAWSNGSISGPLHCGLQTGGLASLT